MGAIRLSVRDQCGNMRKDQPRIGANHALRAHRIGFAIPHSRKPAPLSCSSLHRDRSGKSCRRPSASLGNLFDVLIFQIFFIGVYKSHPLKFSLLTEIEQYPCFDTGCFQIMKELS